MTGESLRCPGSPIFWANLGSRIFAPLDADPGLKPLKFMGAVFRNAEALLPRINAGAPTLYAGTPVLYAGAPTLYAGTPVLLCGDYHPQRLKARPAVAFRRG